MSGYMTVAHNLFAMNGNRQLGITNKSKQKSTEKLSSGYRINRAADDAAGLSISEKMRNQIRGLNQGTKNAEDGISLCQVADGALAEVSAMLQRITELSVKSANDTNNEEDRQAIQDEITEILGEIDEISDKTRFNNRRLFREDEIDGTQTELTPFETARQELVNGTFKQVTNDIVFSNGQVLSKRDANTIIKMCSNCAIVEDFENNLSMDYASSVFAKVVDNNRAVYEYCRNVSGDDFDYHGEFVNLMEKVKLEDAYASLSDLVNDKCENDSALTWAATCAQSVADQYTDVYYEGYTAYYAVWGESWLNTAIGYLAGSFPNQDICRSIAFSKENFCNSMMKAIEVSSVRSGELYDMISDTLWGGDNKMTGVIDIYMFLAQGGESSKGNSIRNFWIQSGANAGEGLYLKLGNMDTEILGINGLNASTRYGAEDAIDRTKEAIKKVNAIRSEIGAQQNRLEYTVNANKNYSENLQNAESLIRDTDMADEVVKLSKDTILQQVGEAMLAQSNQSQQGILSVLK